MSVGCFGFRPLKLMNRSLLGKWLWGIGDSSEGVWKRIILAKYGVGGLGQDIPDGNFNASAFWRSCLATKEAFMASEY